MGTPEFAVPTLQNLHKAGHEIVAVVTAPDKPAGRGRKLQASAVKWAAVEMDLPVLQPTKLRDPDFVAALKATKADLAVVVAFRMLPEMVWEIPSQGTLNLHSSLLPDYRGAAPINWVIINGETHTGVSTFMIDKKIDTGALLLTDKVEIPIEWTAGQLHDHLKEVGADLALKTVQQLEAGNVVPKPQDDSLSKNKAPKIFRPDCEIDWDRPAMEVYNKIRGLSPYPAAFSGLDDKVLKIYYTQLTGEATEKAPGTLLTAGKDELWVACQDEWLKIHTVQLQGKKRMSVQDFLRGYKGKLDQLHKGV